MSAPSWDDLILTAVTPAGAIFVGEHGGVPATVARLTPAAAARVRARLPRLPELSSRAILDHDLSGATPWIAEAQPAAELSLTADADQVLARVAALAGVLHEAQRAGLEHGALRTPGAVGLDVDGLPSLSFLVAAEAGGARDACGSIPEPDAVALGHLIAEWCAPLAAEDPRRAALLGWAERLVVDDPWQRPTLEQLVQALSGDPVTDPSLDETSAPLGAAEPMTSHPRTPASVRSTVRHRYAWSLESGPAAVWGAVANTERINRALGLGAVEQTVVREADGAEPAVWGRSSQVGFELVWRERPHEWVVGQRLGVVREYESGPLRWLRSTVELTPREGGGTELVHTLEAEPSNVLARAVVGFELGVRLKRGLDRVYRRIDGVLTGAITDDGAGAADPFEPPETLSRDVLERLATLQAAMIAGTPAAAPAIDALIGAVRTWPAPELARVRPLALARLLDVDEEAMITACLAGVEHGLLVAGWDLLCPSCRVPSDFASTLQALTEHGHCEVCALDYGLDLTASIELVFQPSPSLRAADRGTYCLSSPAHAPHVAAQVTLAPGERVALELALAPGSWRITRVGAPASLVDVVEAERAPAEAELRLSASPSLIRLAAGAQRLVLDDDTPHPARVRVESARVRSDALTAARALGHPSFAAVMGPRTLADGVALAASSMSFLALGASDDGALEVPGEGQLVRRGEGWVLLAVDDPQLALGLALSAAHRRARVSLELGAALARAVDGGVDYQGESVVRALENLARAEARDVVLGPHAASDARVLAHVEALGAEGALAMVGAAGAGGIRFRAA